MNSSKIYNQAPFSKLLYLGLLVVFFFSCGTSKKLGKEEQLLRKTSIELTDPINFNKRELEPFVKQKPNKRILGFYPFHLQFYFLMERGKERKWKKKLQEVIGEEPVIYDLALATRTASNMEVHLQNKGYYRAHVEESIDDKGRQVFKILPNVVYTIGSLTWNIQDSTIKADLSEVIIGRSLLATGKAFDLDLLENERNRISQYLRNRGYFQFSRDYIDFIADTTEQAFMVNVQVRLRQFPGNQQKVHPVYTINQVFLYLDLSGGSAENEVIRDTIVQEGGYLIYSGGIPGVKASRLFSEVSITPDELFSASDVDLTYRQLTALQQFRYINIVFDEALSDTINGVGKLDCHISLNTMKLQSYQVEFEGSNSSNHWGIGANLNYNHRNLYRGAEMLSLKFRGAFEYQQDIIREDRNALYPNIFDYGVEANLRFPEFKLPFSSYRVLEDRDAKTNLFLMYNHQKRPFYTRTLLNGSYGYLLRPAPNRTHAFNPVELNIISLTDTTPEFNQIFDTLFLRYSYESQFISSSNYTYQYNNQDKKKRKSFVFLTARGEVAGNLLALANNILGRQQTPDGFYEMFSTRFAQYVKADADIRYYQYLRKNSMLVYRGFIGVGLPYGNNLVLPFIKKYFIGGPNSIRAWRIRSLGPGAYIDNSFFPDLNADIKLEGNIEFRFDIINRIKGAVFVDAGNIWAINEYDERSDAVFYWNRFYKQIAVGSGFGIRYDLEFILFRIDLGIKVANPELPSNQRWLLVQRNFQSSDLNWNFGIDYPF